MQAIKDKLNDMQAMRKAKAEAKEEENAEKELAKTRVEVAKEMRMAREAEAAMDLHVQKAAEKVADHEAKITHGNSAVQDVYGDDIYDQDSYSMHGGHSADLMYGAGGASAASGHNTAAIDRINTHTTHNKSL